MLISFLPPLKKVSFCLTEILGNKVILAVRSALHLILHSLLRWMFFFPRSFTAVTNNTRPTVFKRVGYSYVLVDVKKRKAVGIIFNAG